MIPTTWTRSIGRALAIGPLASLATVASTRVASADTIPYPDSGFYNATSYTFTAASTADVIAYIVGGFGAGFENQLGLLINGVDTGIYGLDNHSSAVGDSINFGSANAGDTLTFVLKNITLGQNAYSDASLNTSYDLPGESRHNHIYSTNYTATGPVFAGVPAGTYVAFEDLPLPGADYNYDDESFVFSNVRATASAPEPATLALMGLGLLGVGRRIRRHATSRDVTGG